MDRKVTTAEIVILAAGAVAVIFSFFSWIGAFHHNASAWSSGLFPTYTLLPLMGLIMAAQIALSRFASVRFPDTVADFTWVQVHLVAAIIAVLIGVCFLIVDKGGASIKFGFVIDLLAAIGLLVGAIMLRQERAGGRGAGPATGYGSTGP